MQNLDRLAELAKDLPANLAGNAVTLVTRMGEVIEGFGDKPLSWRPSTLKLVQAASDRSKLPKAAIPGSFMLGEDIIEQPFKIIPLRIDTTRQYWNTDPDKAQMICNSPDAKLGYNYGDCYKCPYSKFDEVNNKSQCNKTLTILCVSADLTQVFFVNFSKTNYAMGMDFQALMKKAGVSPYKKYYKISSATSTKSKNVEVIKAEGVSEEKVDGPVLAFVEELFKISSEDRKAMLAGFYEYVDGRNKGSQLQLGLDTPAADHVVHLLTAIDESEGQEVIPSESQEPTQAAKRYKL